MHLPTYYGVKRKHALRPAITADTTLKLPLSPSRAGKTCSSGLLSPSFELDIPGSKLRDSLASATGQGLSLALRVPFDMHYIARSRKKKTPSRLTCSVHRTEHPTCKVG